MLVVPVADLMDYDRCYHFIEELLHAEGLHCSRCQKQVPPNQSAHKYTTTGLPVFKCRTCGRVFNVYTHTLLEGIHYSCITIVLMLRGFAQGKTTLHLSKELSVNYKNLLDWRHRLQEFSFENRNYAPLTDKEIESDEVFINAGQKGEKHSDAQDRARVRANQKKG